jgi:hypothetical protein
MFFNSDCLCDAVARGPGFDSRHYEIFCIAVGLDGVHSALVRINEELLERKVVALV